MKLLITQANLTLRGGAERILLKIAQHYNADIYTAEYDEKSTFPEFGDLNVNVIGNVPKALPYGRASQGLSYGTAFYNYVIKEDYDVINAHIAPSHWIRNRNERVLWYCHTPLREVWDLYDYRMSLRKFWQKPIYVVGAGLVRRMDRRVTKDIEFIFANNKIVKERLAKYLNRPDSVVLNGGIEYETFRNEDDDKYFFYPSRFSPNKRQDFAIRAFEIFRKKHPNYKLILSGSVSRDPLYLNYYKKLVKMASGSKGVLLLTDVDEERLRDFYARCTAVVYVPVNEDYGLVPLEAQASGKPVIAINEGGPMETVVNAKTGFLINNEKELAEAMEHIASHPARAKEMGQAGISRIRKSYSWNRFFEVFDEGLKKVSKKPTS